MKGEAGIDNRDDYPYGYCFRWTTILRSQGGQTYKGESVQIAALRARESVCSDDICGSCNRNLFEMWLEQCLVLQLQ